MNHRRKAVAAATALQGRFAAEKGADFTRRRVWLQLRCATGFPLLLFPLKLPKVDGSLTIVD
jgi:hypothetical protein